MNTGRAVLFACVLATAQSQQPPAAVIKMTTRQVLVNVVVHDKNGQPVRDLKREDFFLSDKGRAQQLSYFAVETNQGPKPASPSLPEGVVFNRIPGVDAQHRTVLPNALTVILLDGLNTRFNDQENARQGLIKFFRQLQPGDQVAIYTLTSKLLVMHDFTTDAGSLLRSLERKKGSVSTALDASTYDDSHSGRNEVDAFLDQANATVSAFFQARRTEATLQALEGIANHLAGVPGRKNLIWLSAGFPLFISQSRSGSPFRSGESFSDQMQRTLNTLNNIGVAVYPVDAHALMSAADYLRSAGANPALSPAYPGRVAMEPGGPNNYDQRNRNNALQQHAVMEELAERTGGRALLGSADIAGAIREAISDTSVSYVLGYSPDHNEWNGSFREIRVRVGRPGLEARYRKGYYATPEATNDPRIRQALLSNAIDSPLMATGLGMAAKVMQPPTVANPVAQVRLVLEARDLSLTRNEKGLWQGGIDVLLVVRDDQGQLLNQTGRELHLDLTPEQYEASQKVGLAFPFDLDAPPKATRARLVMRDVMSGALGSIDLLLR